MFDDAPRRAMRRCAYAMFAYDMLMPDVAIRYALMRVRDAFTLDAPRARTRAR